MFFLYISSFKRVNARKIQCIYKSTITNLFKPQITYFIYTSVHALAYLDNPTFKINRTITVPFFGIPQINSDVSKFMLRHLQDNTRIGAGKRGTQINCAGVQNSACTTNKIHSLVAANDTRNENSCIDCCDGVCM